MLASAVRWPSSSSTTRTRVAARSVSMADSIVTATERSQESVGVRGLRRNGRLVTRSSRDRADTISVCDSLILVTFWCAGTARLVNPNGGCCCGAGYFPRDERGQRRLPYHGLFQPHIRRANRWSESPYSRSTGRHRFSRNL